MFFRFDIGCYRVFWGWRFLGRVCIRFFGLGFAVVLGRFREDVVFLRSFIDLELVLSV